VLSGDRSRVYNVVVPVSDIIQHQIQAFVIIEQKLTGVSTILNLLVHPMETDSIQRSIVNLFREQAGRRPKSMIDAFIQELAQGAFDNML
jgi:hypothetical protein